MQLRVTYFDMKFKSMKLANFAVKVRVRMIGMYKLERNCIVQFVHVIIYEYKTFYIFIRKL